MTIYYKNKALSIGATGYLQIPYNAALKPVNAITLEVWFKKPDYNFTGAQHIVSCTQDGGWSLNMTGGSGFGATLRIGGTYYNVPHPISTLVPNKWHHMAYTYDGQNAKLYLDGDLVNEVTYSRGGPISYMYRNPIIIGRDAGTSGAEARYYFSNGFVDEFRIWGIARTPEQIKRYYNVRAKGTEEGLLDCWNFENISGTTAHGLKSFNGTLMSTYRIVDDYDLQLLGEEAKVVFHPDDVNAFVPKNTDHEVNFNINQPEPIEVIETSEATGVRLGEGRLFVTEINLKEWQEITRLEVK
jgi:Concanavalin A-like lectin/glucanases superfamily